MTQSVFLTGASGFIGGYVLKEFVDNGWEVHALTHRTVSGELKRLAKTGTVSLHQGDTTSLESLQAIFKDCGPKPFDAVVHCAGRASDVGRREAFKRTNYEAVQHLGKLTLDTGVGRLVFVSSTDVYGMKNFDGETEEALPFENRPANPYPKYKIEAEKWLAAELTQDRYAVVRPAAVWGKGDLTITKRVVDFLRVSPWIVHFGKWKGANRWPLAHVRNVAATIYLLSSEPGGAGQIINVLDSERTSIEGFYRMIAEAFFPDKSFKSITIPFCVAAPVAHLITAVSNLLQLAQPLTDPSHYALLSVSNNLDFSNQRFLKLLENAGRRPVTLQEGLEELSQDISK